MDARLQQAIQFAKNGQRDSAQNIVREVIKENPKNADGWFVAAYLMENKDKRIDTLRRVLVIDPNHTMAKNALDKLNTKSPLDELFEEPNFKPPIPIQSRARPIKVSKSTSIFAITLIIISIYGMAATAVIVKLSSANTLIITPSKVSALILPTNTTIVPLIIGKWTTLDSSGVINDTIEFDSDGLFHESSKMLSAMKGNGIVRGQWKYTTSNHIRVDATYGSGELDTFDYEVVSLTADDLKVNLWISSFYGQLGNTADPKTEYFTWTYQKVK